MTIDLEREEKPLEDDELEMVVQVIRRGLKDGDKIEKLTNDLARFAVHLKEAGRRLKEAERIGQEVCRRYERRASPFHRPQTTLDATAEMRWIKERSDKLKELLQ